MLNSSPTSSGTPALWAATDPTSSTFLCLSSPTSFLNSNLVVPQGDPTVCETHSRDIWLFSSPLGFLSSGNSLYSPCCPGIYICTPCTPPCSFETLMPGCTTPSSSSSLLSFDSCLVTQPPVHGHLSSSSTRSLWVTSMSTGQPIQSLAEQSGASSSEVTFPLNTILRPKNPVL